MPQVLDNLLNILPSFSEVKLGFWILLSLYFLLWSPEWVYNTCWCCSALLRSQRPETPRFHHKEDYNRFMAHRKWVMKCLLLGIYINRETFLKLWYWQERTLSPQWTNYFPEPRFFRKLSLPWRVIHLLLGLWITCKAKRIKREIKNIYFNVSKDLNFFYPLWYDCGERKPMSSYVAIIWII